MPFHDLCNIDGALVRQSDLRRQSNLQTREARVGERNAAYAGPPLRCEKAVSALVTNSSRQVLPSSVARFARRIAAATSFGSATRSAQAPSERAVSAKLPPRSRALCRSCDSFM